MALQIRKKTSPNFSGEEIPVEFLVIHYTACHLEDTLRIFSTPERQVCAHFVLDQDGTVYDLGEFWNGPIRKGAHAGRSLFYLEQQKWESFNGFSIGIEIVNFNGNLLAYPQSQYESLIALVKHLRSRFEKLNDPNRIVGHEHIAGFRGKVDPGIQFDWKLLFSQVYPNHPMPERLPVLNSLLWSEFESRYGKVKQEEMKPQNWSQLSAQLEAFVAAAAERAAEKTPEKLPKKLPKKLKG